MEIDFCKFKTCEPSKDFMIFVEALIKPLRSQKKNHLRCNFVYYFYHFYPILK